MIVSSYPLPGGFQQTAGVSTDLEFSLACFSALILGKTLVFLHSIDRGRFICASSDIMMSFPLDPIGLDTTSSSGRLKVSLILEETCFCNSLPFALHDWVFIYLISHLTINQSDYHSCPYYTKCQHKAHHYFFQIE